MANWKALTIISVTIGLCGLILIIVLFTATGGYVPFDYGVVLDAGSSHTQVTLYHWLGSKNRCTGVVEELDTCKIEGGINSYNLNNTGDVGKDLLECVTNVSKTIAKDRLFETPIYLGATAGMRLLNLTNPISVKLIFTLIEKHFQESTGMQTKTIDIISGQSEGLFSWITNNYLMEKLIVETFDNKSSESTIGMLDMGGASAQIAYRTGGSGVKHSLDFDEVNVRLYGINHTVRASSNLCFGADQAFIRLQKYLILIKNKSRTTEPVYNPCMPIGSKVTVNGNAFKDQICVKTKNKDIDYHRNYTFEGQGNPDECLDIVLNHLINKTKCEEDFETCFNVSDSPPPDSTPFYALSSYYYTFLVLNQSSNNVSVDQYMSAMKDFCRKPRVELLKMTPIVNPKYVDVYCFQLNFIYSTIKNIYRFNDNQWPNIVFANTIERLNKKTHLGWSLGFMINATNAIAVEKPTPPVVQLIPFTIVTIFCSLILLFSIYFALKWMGKTETEPSERYEPISITS